MTAASAAALPGDVVHRERISSTWLDQTLFVEAGAGTGKTTQLVDRIVNLVLTTDVSLSQIAAITFTEAAASELQSRIRVAFERRAADPATSEATTARCHQAIADADLAAISTVHGFASRILSEFSVAAGLPPRVSVLDEVSSQLAHEQRWDRFVDGLHDNGDHDELLYRAALIDAALVPRYPGQASFKDVAANFSQNWDRIIEVAEAPLPPLGPIDGAQFDAAVGDLERIAATCNDSDDKLIRHIQDKVLPTARQVAAVTDDHRRLRFLRDVDMPRGMGGRKAAWGCDPKEIKNSITALNDAARSVVDEVGDAVVRQLMHLTAREVLDAAQQRAADGGLEFHDLLVLARQMLRRNAEVRRALHERYRHVLLDEFQDTDPIQIELASLIAATPSDVQPTRWQDHHIDGGRLFFVGDPKQSIYRFRRADIELFLEARTAYGIDDPVRLQTNFRTVRPIIEWVNGVFDEAMPHEVEGAQPKYEPLEPWRAADSGGDHRPVMLGGEHPDPKVRAADLREAEAADVGALIADIRAQPDLWPVFDQRSESWRPATLSDITILIPTRTSLPYLREALDRHAHPYRLATGTLVYDTQEVRDALAALRAIDDPDDTLSLIAALRSPLYGCSDVDLFTYHQANRRWDLRSSPPDELDADHPVVLALAHLRSAWSERWWLGPAALLERIIRERHGFLLGYGDPRPAEVWRRLRFLLDQARAYEESTGADLRSFLEWAALQSAEGARVHEPLLPESDDHALQILTVHGAKGLEFPITILSGMTTRTSGARPGVSVLWRAEGPPDVRLRSDIATTEHKPRADLEEEMGAFEKLRLLYVAATRARDHLVVSCHHKTTTDTDATFATRLSGFGGAHPERCRKVDLEAHRRPVASVSGPAELPAMADDTAGVFAERAAWVEDRRELLSPFDRPATLSATAIARTVDADIVDTDDDSAGDLHTPDTDGDGRARPIVRRKGRAGSAIGRAVHASLEFVDLTNPVELDAQIARQCELEAISEHLETVAALVRSALRSDAVGLARTYPVHKELYVAAPLGSITIEGYIDLLVETPDGLIIVDYKTDSASSPAEIDAKVAAYELQGAAYAVALETSTGLPVIDCRFVFCKASGAIERSVFDLESAKQRVRDTVIEQTR